jgi:peptidoglycan hydrolase-like protein with peptidoglycan-binding domain
LKAGQAILIRMVLAVCVLLLVPNSWATSSHAKGKAKSTSHAKSTTHKKSTSAVHRTSASSKKSRHSKSRKPRGQQAIDSDRTREIQEALIREHYLQGDATGSWDSQTKSALAKFQHDNGWQTKVVPDSRALIKLGLGPSHDKLLNPESAAISNPRELGMQKAIGEQADGHK